MMAANRPEPCCLWFAVPQRPKLSRVQLFLAKPQGYTGLHLTTLHRKCEDQPATATTAGRPARDHQSPPAQHCCWETDLPLRGEKPGGQGRGTSLVSL